MIIKYILHRLTFVIFLTLSGFVSANSAVDPAIDDQPLREALSLPDWFKQSFLDLKEDLDDARRGRRGMILYFGQSYCPYCKALLTNNWGRRDIVAYTRANFDVIAINTRSSQQVIDLDGTELSEKMFAVRHKANFTPTLIFFDKQGKLAMKMSGYRKPYQFRAALEFVADMHHRNESFRDYLARAEGAESYGQDAINDSEIFTAPPHDLTRYVNKSQFAVFFEEKQCHSCDVLHAGPLRRSPVLHELRKLNSVQLDMWSDTPIVTPDGKKTTAKHWADQLALDYSPTIIFFDETGKEIIRVDSVVGFFRLMNVLQYVTSKAYLQQPSYPLWRSEQRQKETSAP